MSKPNDDFNGGEEKKIFFALKNTGKTLKLTQVYLRLSSKRKAGRRVKRFAKQSLKRL